MKNLFERLKNCISKKDQESISLGYREQLAANLETFRGFGDEGKRLAEALLETEKFSEDYLSSMEDGEKLPKEMAEELMERGKYEILVKHLDKFNICHRKLVDELFKHSEETLLIENLDKFKGIKLQKIINKLINNYEWERVSMILEKYNNFNGYTVERLLKSRESEIVVNHLNSFNLTHSEIADKMIMLGGGYTLAKNLDKFQGLNHKDLAIRLTKKGYGECVLEYRDNFKCENELLEEIAILLIKKGGGWIIFENLNKFGQLNLTKLGKILVARGYGDRVLKNLDKFKGLDSQEIVHILMSTDPNFLIWNMETLDGLDHNKLVEDLIKDNELSSVAYNLSKLKGLHVKIAKILCENYYSNFVAENIDSFVELDVEVAEMIIRAGYKEVVLQHLEKFGLKKEK